MSQKKNKSSINKDYENDSSDTRKIGGQSPPIAHRGIASAKINDSELKTLNDHIRNGNKGNEEALKYYKLDTTAYYYIISSIIRFGMQNELQIPYSDKIIIDGNLSEYPNYKLNTSTTKPNNISKLYASEREYYHNSEDQETDQKNNDYDLSSFHNQNCNSAEDEDD